MFDIAVLFDEPLRHSTSLKLNFSRDKKSEFNFEALICHKSFSDSQAVSVKYVVNNNIIKKFHAILVLH